MDGIVRQCLEWILLESDAPKDIKQKALTGLAGETCGVVVISDIQVANETYEECEQLMRENKKIMAIKKLRQMSGCGLKEAKEAIELEFNSIFNQVQQLEERGL